MQQALNYWSNGLSNFFTGIGRNLEQPDNNYTHNATSDTNYDMRFQNFNNHNHIQNNIPNNLYSIPINSVAFNTGGFYGFNPYDFSQFSPQIPNPSTAAITALSGMKRLISVVDIGNITAHYYDIEKYVGCGGSIRFFLLCKQVKHNFVNIPLDSEDLHHDLESVFDGKEIKYHLPVIIHQDNNLLYELLPSLRYLSRKIGEYGIDAYRDYVVDLLGERILKWRTQISLVIFDKLVKDMLNKTDKDKTSNSEDEKNRNNKIINNMKIIMSEILGVNSEDINNSNDFYLKDYLLSRRDYYSMAESILSLYKANPFIPLKSELFLSNNSKPVNEAFEKYNNKSTYFNTPSYSEILLFSILFDDIKLSNSQDEESENLKMDSNLINEFPHLKILYSVIMELPLISQWNREVEDIINENGEIFGEDNEKLNNQSHTSLFKENEIKSNKLVDERNNNITEDYSTMPHSSNVVTYKLAPPVSQVVFPNITINNMSNSNMKASQTPGIMNTNSKGITFIPEHTAYRNNTLVNNQGIPSLKSNPILGSTLKSQQPVPQIYNNITLSSNSNFRLNQEPSQQTYYPIFSQTARR
ncbi:uncharacterized protein CMU_020370 [Cryptosporidium muris RN66]|uniref:Uncharacterized protein n=1 Tax=Cryptosporidium muris (strain RN66) TaxID=441375 RepID=B6AJ56_CRYMR|nr:uncharacterized protein CMU_020370 [Cryptosporidium muris RN66]EEA08293.1 hypothetical protein, conserved [Cryptosporidium muris RN66]|eukprot:XP_002142642.1 hypothetical protein [Cryptosporidium muris RN66]